MIRQIKQLLTNLEEAGALLKLTFITHSYPHDWRTKKPVIFRATAQWFASIKDFREELLKQLKKQNGYQHGEKRDYLIWFVTVVTGVFPVNVYGVFRFQYFMLKMENQLLQMKRLIMYLTYSVSMVQIFGLNEKQKIYFQKDLHIQDSPNGIFTKETDIMDVWFDSGSSHQAVLEERDDLTTSS